MIRHLLKLVWRRKRSSALLIVEIFVSTIVLFFVVTLTVDALRALRRPLGFDYQNVLVVDIGYDVRGDDQFNDEQKQRAPQLLEAVRGLGPVIAVAGTMNHPYSFGGYNSGWDVDGRYVRTAFDEVTDDFRQVMGIEIGQGRWFGPEDDAAGSRPVVINRRLARDLYADAEPLGQLIPCQQCEIKPVVVGVIDDFRMDGETAAPANFMLERKNLADATDRPPQYLLLKVQPGTGAAFEEQVIDTLQAVAPGWSFKVEALAKSRERMLRIRTAPIFATAVVAAFLMAMVALGLLGVFWQSVARRRGEIGLRRAKGATARGILGQFLAEVLILTALGATAATLVIAQLPLLGITSILEVGTFPLALGVTLVLLFSLTSLAGLYPAYLATRIEPSEALRWE